ncbi:ArsR/SmtB family transcription factor [Xanthomonas nasturtii]|uniref:ArsR/SmtB family transcription factor n=1 Tax=Xanthomonas nasturtii TaxID=1843581 RepID=UPI002682CF22|nr:hypothetical protein [Xanthomonas nasturtii]WVL51171.1 hypothetical protein M3O59_010690 [Xanthomonas nasturtii]
MNLVVGDNEVGNPSLLEAGTDTPGSTLSFHLKKLPTAGLVTAEKRGRTIRYRANFNAMNGLIGYLTENCCAGDQSCGTPERC